MHGKLLIKRIYLPASDDDGERCLVDRLWPRGIKKETAHIDAWMKDVAPSNEIRKDFNHEVEKFPAFRAAYKKELSICLLVCGKTQNEKRNAALRRKG